MFLKRSNQNHTSDKEFSDPKEVGVVSHEAHRLGREWRHEVIYNGGLNGYAIAIGKVGNQTVCGIRWNGNDKYPAKQGSKNDTGMPANGGYPEWFILPDFLAETVIRRAIEQENITPLKWLSGETDIPVNAD